MDRSSAPQRTAKGQRTRAHIFRTAIALFAQQGYEQTTMRAIAAGAGCSLGLAYHYFAAKEDLVLALYSQLADDLEIQVRALPAGPLAVRFHAAVGLNLALLAPYRSALLALFVPALRLESGVAVLGTNTQRVRQQVAHVFTLVVAGAGDAPPVPQAAHLATTLYGLHLALVLFWIQDRSPATTATEDLRGLLRDGLTLVGPLLCLPEAAAALARLMAILDPALR